MGSVATVKSCEVEVGYRLPANCFQPRCVDQVGVVKLVQEDWNNHLLGPNIEQNNDMDVSEK